MKGIGLAPEAADLVEAARQNLHPLTPWANGFLADIVRWGGTPTPAQMQKLREIAARRPLPTAGDLSDQLRPHTERLTSELLPNGQKRGNFWTVGNLQGEHGRSLIVHLSGEKAGNWSDKATDEHGDILDLIAATRCGGSLKEAVRWASAWLGGTTMPTAPSTVPSAAKTKDLEAEAKVRQRRHIARSIWDRAVPAAGNPTISRYLQSRSLTITPPDVLHFNPACKRGTERLPAMIAAMTDPATGEFVGIHRTYLQADGSGKADGDAKKMLGGAGVIRLSSDEDVTTGLAITEGIENALTILQAGLGPVWAAGTAGGIAGFPVLPGVECLSIYADADQVGMDAARKCARRWAEAGRETLIIPPKRGDWNDVARSIAA